MASPTPLRSGEFFLLRTPARSFDTVLALRETRSEDEESLAAHLEDPLVREGIYLSSASLYDQCFGADAGVPGREAQLAATRYLLRMGTRATPFGVMAGVTMGVVGESTELVVGEMAQAQRFCRLDQGIVQQRVDEAKKAILAAQALNGTCTVVLNSSAWIAPDGVRFVSGSLDGGTLAYRLDRIRRTVAVDALFALLAGKKRSLDDLAAELALALGARPQQSLEFLRTLARSQLLRMLPDVYVTGDERGEEVLEELVASPLESVGLAALQSAADRLETISPNSVANIEAYQDVAGLLAENGQTADRARLVHVDLHKTGETPMLSRACVDEIGAELWKRRGLLISPPRNLSDFARSFTARFGDRAVPLLLALDDDYGVSFGGRSKFPQPLLGGFPYASATAGAATPRPVDRLLTSKFQEALRANHDAIEITDADLESVNDETLDFPSSFGLLGLFHANDAGAITRGDYRFEVGAIHGPSGARLLSRFCVGSPEMTTATRQQIDAFEGEHDHAIVAEFAHLPEGRVGNVVLRPVLRQYEIPYMGRSGAAPHRQIPVSDLLVSVRNDKVFLHSESLGKEIIPRLTTAHNYAHPTSLPLYQFMGALERQFEPVAGFAWPSLLQGLPYLPRVCSGRLLLARARWLLAPKDLEAFLKDIKQTDLSKALSALCAHHRLPRHVRSKRADNFIDLDLTADRDQQIFAEECRRARSRGMNLEESFDDEQCVRDPKGASFKHEVLIPYFRRHPADIPARKQAAGRFAASGSTQAHFPGQSYVYAKLYGGLELIDRLAAELVPMIALEAKELGWNTCFFIRYAENGSHLRLRLGGETPARSGEMRNALENALEPYIRDGVVHNLEYATYFPEYDRYGGADGMPACEAIFTADSLAVAEALRTIRTGHDREGSRWRFALHSLNGLADALGFDVETKHQLFDRLAEGYAAEFQIDRTKKQWLNDTYRRYKDSIDGMFLTPHEVPGDYREVLTKRNEQVAAIVAQQLPPRLRADPRLAESLLHMAANRIFPDNGRAHECVLFHLLAKGLRATAARKSRSAKAPALASIPVSDSTAY
ncbi:lantibiotic dehydratase [Sphingomonas sp. UYAg733]